MYLFGTDEYINHIVKTYSSLLLRLSYTWLKSTVDAEDAVQEVFLKLISKNPSFQSEEHERAWLIRTTINHCKDILKKSSRRDIPLDESLNLESNPEGRLLSAVLSLPEKYSTVIYLYHYAGYSIKEISKILNLPAATVGTRLSRGRAQLKQIVEEEVKV